MNTPEKVATEHLAQYKGYRSLPPIAGIASMTEAAGPGLLIEDCVKRLKRYHYAFKRLHQILTARITAEPIYELKMAFSHHSYLCSEHVMAMRARVAEMREPPLGLDVVPDENLEIFFDEILSSPDAAHLLVGVYEKALPALETALHRHLKDTNPLADAPSVRVCRFALIEVGDMLRWGEKAIPCVVEQAQRDEMSDWLELLDEYLSAAGALDGVEEPTSAPGERKFSVHEYEYDPVPKRDERFSDLFNQGVNAEAMIHDPNTEPRVKNLMLLFKRIREIDVPEMMARIIHETNDKPWKYYRDMSRQLWDEARHAMIGEVGFAAMGVDWTQARITHNWSLRLNTEVPAEDAHAVLWFIEQGLMGKDGKRYEFEVGRDSGNPLVALFQDYDWADEVLHAAIGREWLVSQFGDKKAALEAGDKAWSKVLSNWQDVKDQGLTEHQNWWPAIYKQACEFWAIEPDPATLGFNIDYSDSRADLKSVANSG